MTYFRPCKNCVREKLACGRREGVRALIKGAGLTSVAFRCAERQPLYAIGQRVAVTWSVNSSCDPEYPEWGAETWPATVVAERGTKFQILVDDVTSDCETSARDFIQNESLYAKVTTAKLTALDEPPRAVCSTCQGVVQQDGTVAGCFGQDAQGSFGGYVPTGCIKAQAACVVMAS